MRSILVACETSGRVREAFKSKGWDAWSCDLLDTEQPGNHFKCDVRDVLNKGWDMMVAHPSCQRLCNSGVRWLAERNLWKELDEAADFFNLLKNAPIPKICLENPIPHKYAVAKIGKYTQIIEPFQHNEPFKKATCLWLKNLPKLVPVSNLSERKQECWLASPGPERWKLRSRTYQGIANSFANQWG